MDADHDDLVKWNNRPQSAGYREKERICQADRQQAKIYQRPEVSSSFSSGEPHDRWEKRIDISKLTDVLLQVTQLNGVRFNWIDESWGKQTEIGVIAQEVEKYFPELITTDQNSGYKHVQYEKLTPILIEAVKELKAENDVYKEQLNRLEGKIEIIERAIASTQVN